MRAALTRRARRIGTLALVALALLLPRGVGHSAVAEVTLYIDADDEYGDEIVGQEIRVIPAATRPDVLELPDDADEEERDQTGYNLDPFQGITGKDGRVVLKGAAVDFGLPPGTTGEYRVNVPNAASTGHNVFIPGKVAAVLSDVPDELLPYLSGATLTYDGLVAVSFTFPLTRDLSSRLGGLSGVRGQELDACKDMAPAGSPDTWPQAPPGSDLPSARLALPEPGSVR